MLSLMLVVAKYSTNNTAAPAFGSFCHSERETLIESSSCVRVGEENKYKRYKGKKKGRMEEYKRSEEKARKKMREEGNKKETRKEDEG